MKIALIAIFLYLLTTTLIYSEPTSLIIPLNDSDIPKEIKPLIKEGYRIKYQGFEENLIEFICKDESSASLLLNEFINSRGGYKILEYSTYSYNGLKGYRYSSTWGKGCILQNENKVYVFNSPSESDSNIMSLLEIKFGKEFPYYYLLLLIIPIGIILYKIKK